MAEIVYRCCGWRFCAVVSVYFLVTHDDGSVVCIRSSTLRDYAALSTFVMTILHGTAFKEEVRTRCKAKLIKDLERTPCRQCGQVNPVVFRKKQEDDEGRENHQVFGFRKEEIKTPAWAKAFNERRSRASRGQRDDLEAGPSNDEDETESLVIAPTPESSKGYETLSQSVHSLSEKAEGVVRKKRLKRVVREEWTDTSHADDQRGIGRDQKGKGKVRVDEESHDGA